MATTINSWSSKAPAELKLEPSGNPKNTTINISDNSLLNKKINLLQTMVDKLESEKESLTYTCSDLKQLLQCVAKQHDKEAERKRNETKELCNKIKQLENALNISEIHSSHLQSVRCFWEDFVDN
ncbi:unnamed protein product [Blepharisma stoltei]|uniref:Uncharacterized protein n=1 Tax=Blepharisma stoltei TaxID=1481888 RepID=A0AAU9K5Y3_9CILI|nr:unnamed protein product [Blepharisma stoltei]